MFTCKDIFDSFIYTMYSSKMPLSKIARHGLATGRRWGEVGIEPVLHQGDTLAFIQNL